MAAVVGGADGEVEPVFTPGVVLAEEFIEVLASLVGDVDQDATVAVHLLWAQAANIHGAARQVVAGLLTSHHLVYLL